MSTKRVSVKNTLFPGRPNYTGPTKGWFGFLHHERLCEQSHDVNERIHYVKREKPKNEVAIRLHNMIYLGGCEATTKFDTLYADYKIKRVMMDGAYMVDRDALYATYTAKDADYTTYKMAKLDALYATYRAKRDALYATYRAKRDALDAEILAYIKSNIPDCAWNGKKLVFP